MRYVSCPMSDGSARSVRLHAVSSAAVAASNAGRRRALTSGSHIGLSVVPWLPGAYEVVIVAVQNRRRAVTRFAIVAPAGGSAPGAAARCDLRSGEGRLE